MTRSRDIAGFASGLGIGSLGGLIGLGGAEFRLPLLVALFRLPTLQAVILNKAMSLIVVAAALPLRGGSTPPALLLTHWDIVVNLLLGTLFGAWWAAGHVITLSGRALNRVVLVLLVGLALLLLTEAALGGFEALAGVRPDGWLRWGIGLLVGLGIGAVAAALGVAGGELLIPTLVLLYGVDIKLAGSLSLAISLPTMLVSLARYREATAFSVLRSECRLLLTMALGSVAGAALGAWLLGLVPTTWLTGLLGVILLLSAIKIFRHRSTEASA